MGSAIKGMRYMWQGFQLIKQPAIRPFVIIPLLINIILFCLIGILAIEEFRILVEWIELNIPEWLHWITWVLWIIFSLITLTLMALIFTFLANLISAPFNGYLAEKVEHYITGKAPLPSNGRLSLLHDIPRTLKREYAKLSYYLPRAILLLLLFVIPVVNIFASIMWLIFNIWMAALQYIDYPMDNHHRSFLQMRNEVALHKQSTLGFGTIVLLLTMIPLINVFVMPAAVAGATAMWLEEYK